MYDHEAVVRLATSIIAWEATAQHLPLPDLRELLATWQHDLAHSLDDFNMIYADHGDHHECADLIQEAMGEVARTATAAAIFTLGLSQRARQAARQN
jgi:LmbE family N-acetylglucosaminyl deacetylase